jgi:hypothetical protein
MTMNTRNAPALAVFVFAAAPALAAVTPAGDAVAARAFGAPDLAVENVHQPLARLPRALALRLEPQLAALRGAAAPDGYYDLRAGRWGTLVLSVPLVPGRGAGNALTWAALGGAPAGDAAYADAVRRAFTSFLDARRDPLGIDTGELGAASVSSHDGGRLVQVMIPRVVKGVRVRDSFVKATLNHGNLVLYGAHHWGDVTTSTSPSVTAARAQEVAAARLAGLEVAGWRRPELLLIPAARGAASAANEGRGYSYRLAWVLGPRVAGSDGTWEAVVDAHGGELVALYDANLYADRQRVVGGIFPVSNDGASPGGVPDGIEQAGYPMAHAYVFTADGTRLTANGEGLVSVPGQYRTDLTGPYLKIVDECGAVDESTTCPSLDLGVSGGTDCEVPAGASPGDTHSARTGFFELNRLIDQAKSWMGPAALPNTPAGWMNRQLPANMNINNSCNAFFSPADESNPTTGSVNFYRDSASTGIGSCRNTGEIPAVFDHEWGHGLDTFDNAGGVSLPGEAYADMTAVMRLNTSCIARGFFKNGFCGGNGDACTECSGVREIDWKKRVSGRPHDLRWVLGQNATVPGGCGAPVVPPTPFNSGPCQRGTHCEGTIIGEAVWDLLKRDLPCHTRRWETYDGGPVAGGRCSGGAAPTMDENTALVLGTRLFYLAGEGVTLGYQCDQTYTSAGCHAGSWYLNMLAADDDDGVLANGTPHMAAIHDAFLRHGISCPSDGVPPTVVNAGCAATPAPSGRALVTAAAGTQSASVTWTAVPGATEYWVLRTDGVHGCDFGKTRVARVPATQLAFAQDGLLDGLTYYYSVVAVGGAAGVPADACAGPTSDCVAVTPLPPGLSGQPGAAVEDTGAAPVMESGDGDPFADNCEVGSLAFEVVNTGGTGLANVRVTAIQPSRPETQVLTALPIALPDLGAGCGGTNSRAAASFRFRAGGLSAQSPLTFLVAVEADGLPGPVTGLLTIEETEVDLALGDASFDFESGAEGWAASSGTFARSDLPPGGAAGGQWYMRSSSATNDACDRARSPKVRLTPGSTLSLFNQFLTEAEGDGETLPFYDRGNVGIVDAQGRRTIVSPDGGRPYNALNAYTGCNNGPGWATSLAQPVNTWAASSWSASALGAAALAGQEVQVEVTYGTDAVQSLEGLQFDRVRLTSVLLKGPDGQPDACAAPPVAADDSATTVEDTPVTIDVLANDSDPNGDPLTVTAVTAPANGTATTNGATVTYAPGANYNGPDAFTYEACDPSGGCDTATVTVEVAAVNDPPVAVADAATVVKNRTATIAVLANDGDPDGDALRVGAVTAPINGTASANANGTVTYAPRHGFVGADRFHYTACDPAGACASARVDVLVQRKAGGGHDHDDFDRDSVRDDDDPDDDNDGAHDDLDPDDDNDGTGDAADDDDDEDGVGDEFDRESSREAESFATDETGAGQQGEHTVQAGPAALVLAVLAEGPGAIDLRIEIRDPAGSLVGLSVPAPGRALAVAPTLAEGTYRVRFRNVGTAPVAYSTTVVTSTVW